jgi:stringent starvation protein B
MTSTRPYLIRAFYDWIVDNDLTPHLVIDAEHADVTVPQQHVEDGQIVLNISPNAVQELSLQNDWIHFDARFGGSNFNVSLPPAAVLGIYARENGHGMLFQDEEPSPEPPDDNPPSDDEPKRPALKIVK